MKRTLALLSLSGLLLSGSTATRAHNDPPPPAPSLKKLEFLVGSWIHTYKNASGMQVQESADISWQGEHLLRIERRYKVGDQTQDHTSFMAYDPERRRYRIWSFGGPRLLPDEYHANFVGTRLVAQLVRPIAISGQPPLTGAYFEPRSKTEFASGYLRKKEKVNETVFTRADAVAQAQGAAPPGTTPEMRKLAFLVGKFTGKVRFFNAALAAEERKPTVEAKWAAQGQAVVEEHRDGSREALSVMTYDPVTKEYRSWAFSPSEQALELSGKFEDDKLVLYPKGSMESKKPTSRHTWMPSRGGGYLLV